MYEDETNWAELEGVSTTQRFGVDHLKMIPENRTHHSYQNSANGRFPSAYP